MEQLSLLEVGTNVRTRRRGTVIAPAAPDPICRKPGCEMPRACGVKLCVMHWRLFMEELEDEKAGQPRQRARQRDVRLHDALDSRLSNIA
jgi:hypothetical protein